MQSLINKKNILIFFLYHNCCEKFAAIVEARMGSSRLLEKYFTKLVIKHFYGI